jgi:hypothetical protein
MHSTIDWYIPLNKFYFRQARPNQKVFSSLFSYDFYIFLLGVRSPIYIIKF